MINWTMHESTAELIACNMVSSFLPIFCIFLAIGAAAAGGGDKEKAMEKMKEMMESCKEQEGGGPEKMSHELEPEHACFYACMMERMEIMKDNEIVVPSKMPHHEEVEGCVKEIQVTDRCGKAMDAFTCFNKAHSDKSS